MNIHTSAVATDDGINMPGCTSKRALPPVACERNRTGNAAEALGLRLFERTHVEGNA